MPDLLFAVDRFIVMEGVVICDGWFSGMAEPGAQVDLLFDGKPLPGQQLIPVDRPDLIEFMQRSLQERPEQDGNAPRRWGFCIRALLPLPPGGGGGFVNPWGREDDDCYSRLSLRGRVGDEEEREVVLEDPANSHLCAINEEHYASLHRFRQTVSESKAPRILEIGSRGVSLELMMGDFAPPAGATYIGMDYYPGENVSLVGDAHRLSELLSEPVDFVYSASTFEHLLMPWKVAVEIARVLRVGGLAYIHTHPSWPLHALPHDFFRFSKFAWAAIFNRHTGFELLSTTHADPLIMSPALQCVSGGGIYQIFRGLSYGSTSCLVRKLSEPTVDWPFTQDDILFSAYPQLVQEWRRA